MKKDNVFSIVAIGCGLIIILSVFLPYITYFSSPYSLWKLESASSYMYILLGLLVIFVYMINKKTELSYLSVGYCVFTSISNIISIDGISGLSIGFYLILVSSIIIGVITFLYKEEKAIPLICDNSSLNNEKLSIKE